MIFGLFGNFLLAENGDAEAPPRTDRDLKRVAELVLILSTMARVCDLSLNFSGQLRLGIFNSFSGQLRLGIFNLTGLNSLDINNSFLGLLPADVSRLGNLKVLNFAGSYFKGSIPPEYGSFEKLEFIHRAGNFLSGNILAELGKLETVTHMEIGYNTYQLSGAIPREFPCV